MVASTSSRSPAFRRGPRIVVVLVVALALTVVAAAEAVAELRLEPVPGPAGAGQPFRSPQGGGPMFVASPPGDTHRVVVGTRDGYLYAIVDGAVRPEPFLDIHELTGTDDANGLQSFAFDADYATNGRLYVMYTDVDDDDPVTPPEPAEFRDIKVDVFTRSAANPDRVDVASRRTILSVPSIWNGACTTQNAHHGGQVHVGEDGYLWISVGDGGDGCGGHLGASLLTTLRGKILRIDPNANGGYAIPPTNPLVGQAGVRREIWAYGLRNPWRFTFDRARDRIVIGDVGNAQFEEINVVPTALAAGAPPPFFGWGCLEATAVIASPCNQAQTPTPPTLTRAHGGPCTSLTGGVVVDDPSLGIDYQGRYLYGYFCAAAVGQDGGNSRLLSADLSAASPAVRSEGLFVTAPGEGAGSGLSSFGEDACGHPYAMNVITGWLFRIEGDTPGPCGQHAPPQTTIDDAPVSATIGDLVSITFRANVRGATFTCALNESPATPCTSPLAVPALARGDHVIDVTARDEAGNVDPTPARAGWRVERTLPLPPPPGGTPPEPPVTDRPFVPQGPAQDTWASIRLLGSPRPRLSRSGRLVLTVGGFTQRTKVVAIARRGGRQVGVGKAVMAKPGTTARVSIPLSRATRALLAERGRLALTIALRLTPSKGARRDVLARVTALRRAN